MKKILPFMMMVLAVGCSKDDGFLTSHMPVQNQKIEVLTPEDINLQIKASVKEQGYFSWSEAGIKLLWSAIVHGDNILTIGYGNENFIDLKSTDNVNVKKEILAKLQESEKLNLKTGSKVLLFDDDVLNFIDVRILNYTSLIELKKNKEIRYLEPAGYNYFKYEETLKSTAGCNKTPDVPNKPDFSLMKPNCMVSWTFDKHKIPKAWNHSTGQGVTIGLIDTGVSSEQSLLGSKFNSGYSSDRYVKRHGVYVDSWWPWATKTDGWADKCSHGTRMAGTIASPRNNEGSAVGVAYNANLVSYRATSDVLLDGYHEKKGVAKALILLANQQDVKIISMSIGHIFTINRIADAIKYAYAKGKLIFAAGGTSTEFTSWTGIIFPARMNETVAVTGVTDAPQYKECKVCHKGKKIDFTIIMQRQYDAKRVGVGIGYYDKTSDYVNGSSVATATAAGIAALVWAKYPSWSKEQVLQRLKESSDLYANKSQEYGYGNIDALLAVQ